MDAVSIELLACILALYVGLLFAVAAVAERAARKGRDWANTGVVYALSLGVYCSTWTYYGSVESVPRSGLLFLAIYLGATLSMFFAWWVLRKLIRAKAAFHITSIADFVVARYGKCQRLGAVATLVVIGGTVPFVALQLKAVTSSIGIVAGHDGPFYDAWSHQLVQPLVALLTLIFTILFGIRKLDPSRRHPGLMVALALESLVKLSAFVVLGVFVVCCVFGGFAQLPAAASLLMPSKPFFLGGVSGSEFLLWMTHLLLGASAVFFLPRQFHVAVIENGDPRCVRTAMWGFPLYLLLANLFVVPIAVAGLARGLPGGEAGSVVLRLPLLEGNRWIAILAFVGGFSAAAGMMVAEIMTVSTMVANNLVMPLVTRFRRLEFLKRNLLKQRWLIAALLLALAHLYEVAIGDTSSLSSMGLMAFAAALQFAPVMLGGVFWPKGNRLGAFLGLCGGFLTWAYTLFFPALVTGGWFPQCTVVDQGPFGIALLRPEALLGVTGLDPLVHSVLWSMLVNWSGYIVGSLFARVSAEEAVVAATFTRPLRGERDAFRRHAERRSFDIDVGLKELQISRLLSEYYPSAEASELAAQCIAVAGIRGKRCSPEQLAELHDQVESVLAGAVGSAAAYLAMRETGIFTPAETAALSQRYAGLLAELRISPSDLRRKIDFHRERETLLRTHIETLNAQVDARTKALLETSKLAALGEMAGGMAHEINNPLGTLRLVLGEIGEEMRERSIDRTKVTGLTALLDEAVQRIASVINQLRSFARDAAGDELTDEPVAPLVSGTLLFCRQRYETHGVAVRADGVAGDLVARCRKTQISQVLLNLLGNAYDAVRTLPDPWIRVEAEGKGDQVEIRVIDAGSGVPAEIRAKIFQPFFTTKGLGKGTGLGLSVSKGLVEGQGGTLILDSSHPNTCFVLRLPRVATLSGPDGPEGC